MILALALRQVITFVATKMLTQSTDNLSQVFLLVLNKGFAIDIRYTLTIVLDCT